MMLRRRLHPGDPQQQPREEGLELIGQELVPTEGSQLEGKPPQTPRRGRRIQDLPALPGHRGGQDGAGMNPRSLKPLETPTPPVPNTSLFTQDQLRDMDEVQRMSRTTLLPLPPALAVDQQSTAEVRRQEPWTEPRRSATGYVGATWEEKRRDQMNRPSIYRMASRPLTTEELEEQQEEIMWRWQMGKEMKELGLMLRATQEENRVLKTKLTELSGEDQRFQTPEEEPKPTVTTQATSGKGRSNCTKEDTQTPGATGSSSTPQTSEEKHMEFMMLMLKSMQEMQRKFFEEDTNRGKDKEDGVEKVSTGITEFPPLPEWDALEAPLKMGDWITVLEPLVADMSSTADEWWALTLKEVHTWYQEHLALSPLDRSSFSTGETMEKVGATSSGLDGEGDP